MPRNYKPTEHWIRERIRKRREEERRKLMERARIRKLPPDDPERIEWQRKNPCCGGAS